MERQLQDLGRIAGTETAKSRQTAPKKGESGFGEILKETLSEVNELQKEGQKAMADMATGQVKDLHQAAIAIDKAELSMKMMLEVRNKAINAYKEILRTQI